MVYTCKRCKSRIPHAEPHFRIYYMEGRLPERGSIMVVECPVCGAVYVDEYVDGRTRILADWHIEVPLRSWVKRIRNWLRS